MTIEDPWLRMQRKWQVLYAVLMIASGACLLLTLAGSLIPALEQISSFSPGIQGSGVIFLLAGLLFFSGRRSLNARTQCRQRALAGDPDMLADEQPTHNEQALPYPEVIVLYRDRQHVQTIYSAILLFFGIMVFISLGSLGAIFSSSIYLSGDNLLLVVVPGVSALILGGFLWQFHKNTTQNIEVDETGMKVMFNGRKMRISWEETRFFCVGDLIQIPGLTISGGSLLYELSGEQNSVLWRELIDERNNTYRPALPFAEYQQQMKGLREVIAARTGLPLYDLRTPFKE